MGKSLAVVICCTYIIKCRDFCHSIHLYGALPHSMHSPSIYTPLLLIFTGGLSLSEDLAEKEELNKQLAQFWFEIDKYVVASPSGSMLRDMARLDIALKSHSLPSDEADKVILGGGAALQPGPIKKKGY